MAETLSPRSLCALNDVKDYAKIALADTTYDDQITRLINSVSETIYDVANREFRPVGTTGTQASPSFPAAAERKFDVYQALIEPDVIYIGDLRTLTGLAVVVYNRDGTIAQTVAGSDVDALPRVREAWEPWTQLRIRASGSASYHLRANQVVGVTGSYGFPAIPEMIRNAAIEAAWHRLARDVMKSSDTYAEAEPQANLPRTRELPFSVFETVRRFRAENW